MDIHVAGPDASQEERAAVDALLGPPASGWEGGGRDAARDGRSARGGRVAAVERRHLLLPAFHAVQDRVGWVSRGALNYICQRLIVPPAEAWGVLTFYHLFATASRPAVVAHVCDDIACRALGAEAVCDDVTATLGAAGRPAGAGGGSTWLRSPCLGQCERAPAALVIRAGEQPTRTVVAPVRRAADVVAACGDAEPRLDALADLRRAVPQAGEPALRLLRRVGVVDPASLDAYRAAGGYRALARALVLGPQGVVSEVTASRLMGRGGAAFPTGRKWAAVAAEPALPHYVVCNADESEPGTFKDRLLMCGDPFAIVEAMTICGIATRSTRGFLYVRGEYPDAEARVAGAIAQARAAGLLGGDVAGSGHAFDIEVRRGAGAYICGEETALFNSLEGRRGEPRSKPPFPAQVGLFGRPTVVNNVETLANVLDILVDGGAAWAAGATGTSTGTRLFCLSGHVARPGLYEHPFGRTLGEVLAAAGGVAGGRPLQAVLLGGAAGVFVGPEALDVRLTFEDVRAAGLTLGSGVIMAFDDTVDLPAVLGRIATFFEDESCGQCVPCRVGTVRQRELLEALRAEGPGARAGAERLQLLTELGQAMRDASICGLGQTASSAIESAVQRLGVFRGGTA
ncbi:MAG: NAD(P)H-dependent oxidoreductase subunit E [Vicinamibacterales bacterium]